MKITLSDIVVLIFKIILKDFLSKKFPQAKDKKNLEEFKKKLMQSGSEFEKKHEACHLVWNGRFAECIKNFNAIEHIIEYIFSPSEEKGVEKYFLQAEKEKLLKALKDENSYSDDVEKITDTFLKELLQEIKTFIERKPSFRDLYVLYNSIQSKLGVVKLNEQGEKSSLQDKTNNQSNTLQPLTVKPSQFNEKQFLHRKTQIEELKTKIGADKTPVLITGFGGIGKTAIFKALYHELEKEHDYEYVAWINYDKNLKQSILNQFILDSDEKDENRRWNRIVSLLTKRNGNLLFFVDNITEEIDPDFQWLTGLNAHLFITSRLPKIHNFEAYEIKPLDRGKSIDVFYCYYEHGRTQEKTEIVGQLVDLVSCHTLSIELLAGIANSQKYRFDLKKFLTDLQDNGFGFPKIKTHTLHTYEELTISEHLAKLFKIADLTDEQRRILANFQIISKGLQVPCDFAEWIEGDGNALNELEKTRWISFSENGYVMHDMVWEAVKLQLSDIPYVYAEKMIKTMASDIYFKDEDEYLVSTKKIQIAEAYAEYFSDREEEEWSDFLNSLGVKCGAMGEHKNALKYFHVAVYIAKRYLEENNPFVGGVYNNIGIVYKDMGKYENALDYYKKALVIYEDILEEYPLSTGQMYTNIGIVYKAIGEYETALDYYKKALAIYENVLDQVPPDIAITYHNIAIVYHYTKDYKNARQYYEKALGIKEEVFGKDHFSTALTYNAIASVCNFTEDYEKAGEYFEKAFKIMQKKLGNDDVRTVAIYHNMINASNRFTGIHGIDGIEKTHG